MPIGMLMKSEPYASEIASPHRGYDVGTYCQAHGLDYVDRVGPLTLERFLGYADWYTGQLVPHVRDDMVTRIEQVDGGFRVSFAGGDPVTARQVVIATGVLPHARIPAELSGLPPELLTHTADVHELDHFKGRRVAVIGAGQSALETAALLHETGAAVQVIARVPALLWSAANPAHLGPAGRIRRPVTQLCEGWRCAFWNKPAAFRMLPEGMRITKARTVLGPNGSWWLKDRIDGVLDVLAGHQVREAAPAGSGVRLALEDRGGGRLSVDADHVIAGTGFRIDLTRLPFLTEALRTRITTLSGYPVVSRQGESSVPGLYIVGAPTAVSLGPSARFIAGTHNISALLAKSVARRGPADRARAGSETAGQELQPSGDAAR